MRLRHIKDAEKIILSSPYIINNPEEHISKWKEVFHSNNPIEIEIGSGRGKFIIEKALKNKNKNYIAIEKYATPILKALKKLEELNIKNLKILVIDASNIDNIFKKEISKIYLNFSDPWPKKRHEKRRLTSLTFLGKYDKIFKDKKIIEMKTDNDTLFDYSLINFIDKGYEIKKINRNHISKITTEYEDKFIKKGKNINFVRVEQTDKI